MSAALKIREACPQAPRLRGQSGRALTPLSPATSSLHGLLPRQEQPYTEGPAVTTQKNTVNARNNTVNVRFRPFVVAATDGVTKEVSRETGIGARTIEDIRCREKLGSVPTFLLLAQRDPRLAAEVRRFLDEGGSAHAIDAIVRRLTK
jgi:hypothetical protein